MSRLPSPPDLDATSDSELLRLKRTLAATHRELDEARVGRPKRTL